jgi:hypothetical protein
VSDTSGPVAGCKLRFPSSAFCFLLSAFWVVWACVSAKAAPSWALQSAPGEDARALAHAREYVREHPAQPEALDLAGVLATRRQSWTEALDYFWRAVRIRPDSARVLNNLGFLYLEMRLPNRALPLLRAALSLQPGMTDGWSNLGQAFALMELPNAESAARGREAENPDSGDSDRRCAAMAAGLRTTFNSPAWILLEDDDPCGSGVAPRLTPETPALIRFGSGVVLRLTVSGSGSGSWIFWSSATGRESGSLRAGSDGVIEIPLAGPGIVFLTASQPLQVREWTIR